MITVPTREHQEIVERWFGDLFTKGHLDAVDELVAPDFVGYGAGGEGQIHESHGREAFREWLRWYTSSFSNREWAVHDVISEGEKAVVRYSGRTTYRGGFLNISSEDQRILETGILIYRIENGMVKELWSEMSDLEVVMQLGAFPIQGLAK